MSNRIPPEVAAQEIWRERFSYAKVIFLAGSVIRGEATPHSDLDLVVLYEKLPAAYRDSFIYKGWPVEVFVHDPETLNYFFLELDRPSGIPALSRMVMEGIEIPQPSGFSQAIKDLAKTVLDAGPPAWTEKEIQRARYMITDLCDDMKSPRSTGELTASVVRLYECLADFYLRAKGLWSAKGKTIPRRLLQTDPELASKFISAFESAFARQDSSNLLTLTEEILHPYGGLLFENSRMDAPGTWRKPLSLEIQTTSAYRDADRLLRKEDTDSIDQALRIFQSETDKRPSDSKAWFELAGAYDFLGRESEALPHYQRVLDLGFEKLPKEDQPCFFVQMGSTLRNLKKYDQARKLLMEGCERFPQNSALKAFLGLVEYSDGAFRRAAKLFLQSSLGEAEDRSVRDYRRALQSYSEEI